METLSAEKRFILNKMSDDDVRLLLQIAKNMPGVPARRHDRQNGLRRLDSLVGLETVKQDVKRIVSANLMCSVAAARGRAARKPNNHMCFIGAPGTCKTSVADICAQIFYENGIVKKNKIIKADRSDLVGEHCGETAIKTKALIAKAKDGVLFLDEAYSLLEDREGGFGDEAINTLVSEIEKKRNEFVLILAGYSDKMKHFLDSNPGLRSRIPNTLYFPDYSPEELYAISKCIASESGYSFDMDVHDKLIGIFEKASKSKNFGNGRYVRNVIENAQSTKALHIDFAHVDQLSDEDLFVLNAKDFSEVKVVEDYMRTTKIGFAR